MGFLSEEAVGGSRVGTERIKTKEQNALGSKGRKPHKSLGGMNSGEAASKNDG